jgi:hypothetical protein
LREARELEWEPEEEELEWEPEWEPEEEELEEEQAEHGFARLRAFLTLMQCTTSKYLYDSLDLNAKIYRGRLGIKQV